MRRQQLEHLLRASGNITGETQFFVIGSQSILGRYPDAPKDLLWSMEVDLIAKNYPEKTETLNMIGELSPFHDAHGYYVDPVDEKTAVLPKGWKSRLINVQSVETNGVTGLCLDPHDLFVSKVAANREKDIMFVKVMIENGMISKERILALAATVTNPENDLGRSKRIVARVKEIYGMVKHIEPSHINEKSGVYTGKILSMSDTIVQQNTGNGKVIYHDAKRLNKLPWLGQMYTIKYTDGVGQVIECDRSKEKRKDR